MLYHNVNTGFAYMTLCLTLILPYYIFSIPGKLKYIYIIQIIFVVLAYGVRPLLLVSRLDFFSYQRVGRVTLDILTDSLYQTSLYSSVFILGFIIGLKFFYSNKKEKYGVDSSSIVKYIVPLNIMIVLMLAIKFILVVLTNAGLKGVVRSIGRVNIRLAFA